MAKSDALVVEEFKKILISHLHDLALALPALIPQSKEDEKLFKEGMTEISNLIYDLEHVDNIRELGRFIDINKISNDFDMESIKTLNSRISTTARNSLVKLDEMIGNMKGD